MADRARDTSRVNLRHSLRLHLPLLIFALVLVMVTTFLWTAYREVEATLVNAGGERAQRAADEVARLLVGTSQGLVELRHIAEEGTLQRYLLNQTEPNQQGVRRRLAGLVTTGPRRIEVWRSAGTRILEISVPETPWPGALARVLPEITGPLVAGVSPLHALDDLVYSDLVAEIPDGTVTSQDADLLGYLVVRATYSVNPPGAIGRLVGQDAVVEIGNRSGGIWTDFSHVIRPPPVDVTHTGVSEYRLATGAVHLGAAALIRDTPWALWVEFPKAVVTAPARTFLRKMMVIAGSFVVIGAMLAFALSSRITQPLEILSLAVHKLAAGDYSRRVNITRKDEMGLLATSFNTMADEVERTYSALRKHHEETRFALAASQTGVWDLDLRTEALSWSDTMPPLFGLKPEDAPRTLQGFLALVHPDDRQQVDQALHRAIEDKTECRVEFRSIWPNGSIHWIVGRGRVSIDDKGQPSRMLGIDIDVSEQKALEEQLRQAQKMEAVGQLAGGVAHDFNNLLTGILGYGTLILEQAPEKSRLHADVTEILRAGESAARLTQQLLAFSRRQIMHPETVLVNDVVDSTEKLLRRLIPENIRVLTVLDPNLRLITIDQGQLEQVIVNLVVNARDAMPDGGTLILETANADLDESYVVARTSVPSGAYVRLTVSDTGVGMTAETQKRLFEPFFTTKPLGKGTGLGLATVFGIIKQSGGHIYVYSELRRGSQFKIYLPVTDGALAAASRKSPAQPLVAGSETILVVEDDQAARELARRVLEHAGYRIIVAANGEDALEFIREGKESIQLVVTDVIMPGITGPELARRIEKTNPDIRILFTSGYTDDAILRRGVLEPGARFIQKPYTPLSFTRKVREALT